MANTSVIISSKFKRLWEQGKAKVYYHEVIFEGQDSPEPYLIGAKKENPDHLKIGQLLKFEIMDKKKRKIKRVATTEPEMMPPDFETVAPVNVGIRTGEGATPMVRPVGALIRAIERFNEEDLVFFDIETARVEDKLVADTDLHAAWLYKARYQNEVLRKTGEPVTPEEYYEDKAALYPPFARIVCIVAGRIVGDKLQVKRYFGQDEKDIICAFNNDMNKMLEKRPSTVFCGWANNSFDQPFVAKRLVIHGFKPNLLLDTAHYKPWEIPSLDLKEVWKGTGFYPDSLIAVAVALGLPSPKSKMDGSQVGTAYYEGKYEEIATYCAQDVLTTANIWRKFKNNGGLVTL